MDRTKGIREDGQFCFMKQFDMCQKDKCSCENYESIIDDSRVKYATFLAEEFEDIENGIR